MALPEWVEKQKRQGFEIKKVGNGYYMYKRTSRWDKEKKKSVKVTGEYIGVVTPDGIVPRKQRLDETKPVFSMEYGATAFIESIAANMLETLYKHFDKKVAQQIWVISVLRLISPTPFHGIEDHYQTSWISEILPNLPLSKSSIRKLINHVGNNRAKCAAFMRDMLQPAPYLLMNGSRITPTFEDILQVLPDHDSENMYLSLNNQIYIATISEFGDWMPGFYRNISGDMPDIDALEFTLEDAGVEEGIILAGNEFIFTLDFEVLEDSEWNLKYIIPLNLSTEETDLATMEVKEYFSYHNRGISAHMDKKDGYLIYSFRDEFCYAKEFSDSICRAEKANAIAMRKRNFDPDKDIYDVSAEINEIKGRFGIIILRTNIIDKPASYIYQIHKTREDFERLFKNFHNTSDQDVSYIYDDAGFEAWSFFDHITISIACQILAKLRELDLLKDWSLETLLDHLSRIHIIKMNEQWHIAKTTKKTNDLVLKLGFNLELNQDN